MTTQYSSLYEIASQGRLLLKCDDGSVRRVTVCRLFERKTDRFLLEMAKADRLLYIDERGKPRAVHVAE